MNARKTVSLALFALTLATPVLAQSGTAVQNKRQTVPDPLALLRPRWSHPATSVGSKSPAPDAVALDWPPPGSTAWPPPTAPAQVVRSSST